jgi:hypothetical protein
MKEFPADKQFTIWFSKLRTTELSIGKEQKHIRRVPTENLDGTEARLEHKPRKSL